MKSWIRREIGKTDLESFPVNGKAARSVKASAAEKEWVGHSATISKLGSNQIPA
jgi:hypothetical protein